MKAWMRGLAVFLGVFAFLALTTYGAVWVMETFNLVQVEVSRCE